MVPGIAWIHRIADGGRDAAFAVVMAAVAPLATRIGERFGYRSVVSTGLLFLSASMFVVTRVDAIAATWFVVRTHHGLMAAGIA